MPLKAILVDDTKILDIIPEGAGYVVELPVPPTINGGLYATCRKTGRMYIKRKYKDWMTQVMLKVRLRPLPLFKDKVWVRYIITRKNRVAKWDVCNFEKALSDTLVKQNVISDDSKIMGAILEKGQGDFDTAIVKVYEASSAL